MSDDHTERRLFVPEISSLKRDGTIVAMTITCDCVTPRAANELYNWVLVHGFAGRLALDLVGSE